MKKLLKTKQGSLTIEACISLIVAIAVSLSISMLLRVVYVETLMQHAITQTANEIAVYSYYLSATGMKNGMDNFQGAVNDKKAAVNKQIGTIMDVSDKFNKFGESINTTVDSANKPDVFATYDEVQKLSKNAQDLEDSTQKAVEMGQEFAKDPKRALLNFLGAAASVGFEEMKSAILQPIVISFMDKHLATEKMDADTHLKKLLVEDGLAGLDFSGSSLFKDQRSVDIIVRYKIKIPSPIPYLPYVNIMQRAKANAWADDGISVWDTANSTLRGKIIQSDVRNLPPTFTTYAGYDEKTKVGTIAKSLDITAKSYQSKSQMKSKINEKICAVENFTKCTRGTITLEKKDIVKSNIIFYVPRDATAEQKQNFEKAVEECLQDNAELVNKNNIKIEIREFDKEVAQ